MHARWYVLSLTYLVTSDVTSIEYLKDENAKTIRVNRGHGIPLDGIPS